MAASISACENVCQDFGWISKIVPIMGDVGSFAAGIGLIIAFIQLSRWRHEAQSRKRAEVAEECLVAVRGVDYALNSIRHPVRRLVEVERLTSDLVFKDSLKKMADAEGVFQKLKSAQVRCDIHFGDAVVTSSIKELFFIRANIINALQKLIELSKATASVQDEQAVELTSIAFSSAGGEDEISKKQSEAVDGIFKVLLPIAQLEKSGIV
ncbi:hypothetical protein [Limimaricola hongkongensis]|uniref:hypothetical protein n=1 Tax=Limimaricola hongkongensis TaxID=278132 RepID=UPI0013A57489|nr:hypothetical protein [Limimaricola hongkongensis]